MSEHQDHTPDTEETSSGSHAVETEVFESDPNADSPEGLAGGMGVSSERVGSVRGSDEPVTYGAAPTHTPDPEGEAPPEQSPYDGQPEVQPDEVEGQPFDHTHNPRHGV